jgi:hypothetical protein
MHNKTILENNKPYEVKKETDMKEMMLDGVLQVGAAPCGGNV